MIVVRESVSIKITGAEPVLSQCSISFKKVKSMVWSGSTEPERRH